MTYKFSFSSFIPVLPDIALCILCIVKNAKLVIRYVYESVGFTYAPSAPIHVIWPIVLYLSLIVYRCILALKREIVSIDLKDSLLSAT
ncbi:hypothetical protein TVAG_098880 [Trichomonas vaginalis G3]|uniref:Uncharacterized protein n=1 Tax=Trichomonas vaginalis (strain ATCC PRA-98 / G3) TaxID=412133 RepID=A2EMD9_TRIV3|nr:calcineurin-like phosphoesterase family [Trichomonas vaginalis G3]EAY06177.1 hypothetical protein TVAG_098880 [Trichomonas vaginalis G3]KAI5544326.1 calcineurin-like phosphoesterase family [Trichomonas vaginalis G3]|eukprot:XP_001318400.1 hypothetical protein [Trichomonas vaginalis G3]